MSDRVAVELSKAYRLMNHGPTVIVTSQHGGRSNIMSAAWSMPLDFSPPKVAVVIDKSTFTRGLIEASGEFVLNIPSREMARLTVDVGNSSGSEIDKFAAYDIASFAGSVAKAPLVEGCLGWLECRLIPEPHIQQAYDLFLGEVVAAWADPSVFDGAHWTLEEGGKRSIHYVAGGHFFEIGAAFDVDEDGGNGQ